MDTWQITGWFSNPLAHVPFFVKIAFILYTWLLLEPVILLCQVLLSFFYLNLNRYFFSCSDKTPARRQFIERRIYFGLQFQRDRDSPWWGAMAVPEQKAESSPLQWLTGSRESQLELSRTFTLKACDHRQGSTTQTSKTLPYLGTTCASARLQGTFCCRSNHNTRLGERCAVKT